MTCLKQTQELEAPNYEQLGKLLSFKDIKARYRKNYLDWDNIERANKKDNAVHKKSTLLSNNAKNLLAPVIGKLEKGERVILNHKYISTITLCERRQNVRIIEELKSILEITNHNSITHNSKKHRHSYEFSYKLKKSENISSPENSIGTFMSRQNDPVYIQEENKDIEYIDLRSNFLKNSEEVFISEVVSFPKIPSKNKIRLPNQRKKSTNAENKAKVFFFKQYDKPKSLRDHYPLTTEE